MEYKRLNKEDGKAFLKILLTLDNETKYMLYEPNERKTTPEEMEDRLDNVIKSGGVAIGAFDEDKLIGFVSAGRGTANRTKHSAYVVAGIRSAYTGKGIGTTLFKFLDEWAKENEIIRLDLTVMIHNVRAVALYKKMGFEIEGTKKNALIVDGVIRDEYYMGKILN